MDSRLEFDRLLILRYHHRPAELVANRALERLQRVRLAMNQKSLPGRGGKTGKPAKQLAPACVRGKLVKCGDFGLHGNVLPMDAQKLRAILQSAPARAYALIADQQ